MTGLRLAAAALSVLATLGAAAPAKPPPGAARPAAAAGADALTAVQIATIGRIAATVIERKATPSVAIGVGKHGRLVFAQAYGYRNLDDAVPADADTLYGIGSNTKQFTAAAILLLRDEGKLDVDAPIARYLPGIAHGGEVSVRNLLTHTGGYAEFTELDDVDRLAARPATNEEVFATVADRPLGFTPGTKWQYSNTGYVLLATIVERLSGMSYADFVRARIFGPLGMRRTRYGDEQLVERDRAVGYSRFAMGAQEHEAHLDYSWFSGAGAVESTLADLEIWNDAIDRGTLLSASSRELMHTPYRLADGTDTRYGFGLFVRTLPGGKHVVLHGGDTTGFGTQDARFVEDGIDVIVLTNQEPAAYNAIVDAVYAAVAPRPAAIPPPAAPAAAAPAQPLPPPAAASPNPNPDAARVDALARRWLEDAIAGKIDLDRLRPSARASLRLQRNRAALRDLARYGERRYRLVSIDRRAPVSAYQYVLTTARRTLLYVFAIDDDGLLGGGDVFDPNPLAPDTPQPAAGASPVP